MKKIIIQFNEANFSLIRKYTENYDLKGFKKILSQPLSITTKSEKEYKNLEPWIQWYSFYSQMDFNNHKVFHLGDCLKTNHKLFTESLAENGLRVGIFGSMNLKPNKNYDIFIPDAWTESSSDNSLNSKIVSNMMKKIINTNTSLKISLKDIIGLIFLIGIPLRLSLIKMIFKAITSFIKRSRYELAALFDYFFINYSIRRSNKKKIDLNLTFLNGLAHVQHHYMLSSEFVDGENPSWYMSSKVDPILSCLKIYDQLFNEIFTTYGKKFDIWIVTGLSQTYFTKPIVYWRFNDHKSIINHFLKFDYSLIPRMTRDFEIKITNPSDMKFALEFFTESRVIIKDKELKAFDHIDQINENSLFVSFVYEGIDDNIILKYKNFQINLKNKINFVAIKNGIHNQLGWAFSNAQIKNYDNQINIWDLPKKIISS